MGLNKTGYAGEGIDITRVVNDLLDSARSRGWVLEPLALSDRPPVWTLVRRSAGACGKVYLSTGMHGDEPAGPLAMSRLIEADRWPQGLDLWVCPCLNPTGFPLNRRENRDGVDLNRDYLNPSAEEVKAHIAWLERQPDFDAAFCLHEDWESHGFYLYELSLGRLPSLAESMIRAAEEVCPIDLSEEIEGRAARGGVIRPTADAMTRVHWPEAFYLLQRKTQTSYTLEAPSDFVLEVRVAALVKATEAALAMVSRTLSSPSETQVATRHGAS